MANIQQYLEAISQAIYGEEVRGSIHDAIDIINKVGEKVLVLGTIVNSSNSSTSGYYKESLYLNLSTWDLWKCTGSAWELQGNLKGSGVGSVSKTGTSGLIDTYTLKTINNSVIGTFNVTNGVPVSSNKTGNTITFTTTNADGTTKQTKITDATKIGMGSEVTATNTSVTLSGVTYYNGDIYINNTTWIIWQCNGTGWINKGLIHGIDGNKIGVGDEVISANTSTTLSGITYNLNDIYFNSETLYVWKCLGGNNGWFNMGSIRGYDGYATDADINNIINSR